MKQPSPTVAPRTGPVVLFDGVCNLCNATVLFIIDRDPEQEFRFASLQSEAGRRLLRKYALDSPGVDSVVLVDEEGAWVESDAALRIARRLGWPWRAAVAARVFPRPARDAVYRWVARNRYRWFGRQDACRLPTAALADRFLPDPAVGSAG